MYFKRNNKLRIIQLYNPPRKHKIINEEIYCKMEYLITTAQIKGFKLIIMKDFNENMNEYYKRKNRRPYNQKFKIQSTTTYVKVYSFKSYRTFQQSPFYPHME